MLYTVGCGSFQLLHLMSYVRIGVLDRVCTWVRVRDRVGVIVKVRVSEMLM